MKKKLFALLLGSSLVLAACGGDKEDDKGADVNNNDTPSVEEQNNNDAGNDTASAIDPEELYLKRCAQCHGRELEGGVGADLTEVGSRLSKEEILKTIAEGTDDGMSPNLLVGEDAEAVAEWLSEKK